MPAGTVTESIRWFTSKVSGMELVAARRPFLYFPLAHHFEQQVHVPQWLAQYRAGRRMDYATTDPELLAEAIAQEIGQPVDYRLVDTDDAARSAATNGGVAGQVSASPGE